MLFSSESPLIGDRVRAAMRPSDLVRVVAT